VSFYGAQWPHGQCARRTIAEAKQHWPVIGWVTKNLLSRAPPCFGRHVKPLVLTVFAVVSTHQSALSYGPFSLWVIYNEGLCPSSGDINRLMMVMNVFFIRYLEAHLRLRAAQVARQQGDNVPEPPPYKVRQ
jgi:hypothetical protein